MNPKTAFWIFLSIESQRTQKFLRQKIENHNLRYKTVREKNVEKNLVIANQFMQWLTEPEKVNVPIPEPPWLDEKTWG